MLLYGFYRVMVSRDTFFGLRRITLWLVYAVALLVPMLNMTYWVRDTPTMTTMASAYADAFYVAPASNIASDFGWYQALCYVYGMGVALLALRFAWQLFYICHLVAASRVEKKEGIKLHVLKGKGSPFSFFRWIFVYPQTLEGGQLHEVLVHECTHARGYHSLDSVFSELFSIVCWFNPFAWLMKQEVRINLEYLADESVLADGNARKSYQYHLLGLAYRKPIRSAEIANNFNLLPLKKRIKMMNKRRTREIGKAKYLLFAPLVGALLMVSNIETVAREMNEHMSEGLSRQVGTETLSATTNLSTWGVEELNSLPQKPKTKKKTTKQAATDKSKSVANPNRKVYDDAEKMPEYRGGLREFYKFLGMNMKYPKTAVAAKKEGTVIVGFVIEEDGTVANVKILKAVDPELDAEALKAVSASPKWIPATVDGKPVAMNFVVPVKFNIPKTDAAKK